MNWAWGLFPVPDPRSVHPSVIGPLLVQTAVPLVVQEAVTNFAALSPPVKASILERTTLPAFGGCVLHQIWTFRVQKTNLRG